MDDDVNTMSPIAIGQVWESRRGHSAIEVVGDAVADQWHVVVTRHCEPAAMATIHSCSVIALYVLAVDA